MNHRVVHKPLEAEGWPVERQWKRLDEVTLGVWDCPHSTPKITEDGPYVVRSQDIRTGIFKYEDAARVSEETYQERIQRAEPSPGDILYSREGTYFGIAAEMPNDKKVCLGQRMVLIRPNPDVLNARFLRMWLNSPALSRHIHGFRDGTVAERLNMPTIRGLPIPEFDRDEQDGIAELLGSFDDKIELNRHMNETLEAMAQAIFRDWFVDFGPTRRKIEGATDPVVVLGGLIPAPEKAARIASLFPATLGDDGLPEGWEQKPISDLCDAVGGATPSTKREEFWTDGTHAWATPKDLSKLPGIFLHETDRTITDQGLVRISSGLSPVGSVMMSSRAPIGYVAIASAPVAVNQGFIVMRPSEAFPTGYGYFWCLVNMDRIKADLLP
ncbi:restriction endonuclease subunit S [Oceaniradius stylonematis]|uniref:restriction endonuclease subunit S n=1 Tax=Oceaniradius stylonematis TaxID=2184161 RepID=UPI00273FC5E9|nr:restriction endonuclease subunit S [Oceaniradius stylonematis]